MDWGVCLRLLCQFVQNLTAVRQRSNNGLAIPNHRTSIVSYLQRARVSVKISTGITGNW